MTTLYVGCHEKNREAILDVRAFLCCYYLHARRSSGQYYICPYEKNYHFVENIKENLKEKKILQGTCFGGRLFSKKNE